MSFYFVSVPLTARGDSGIVYCLSKKDAEQVADELAEWSGGLIKVRSQDLLRIITDARLEYTMPVSRKPRKRGFISSGGKGKSSKCYGRD